MKTSPDVLWREEAWRGTKEVEGKRGAERKKWYFESERKRDKNHLRTKQ